MTRRALAILCLALAAPSLPAAWAAGPAPQRAGLSLEQAVELVQRRTGARVVRTETVREGDETIYRLRLLGRDGRVTTAVVHATSGQVD
jgi:uncharacterized membrane protein YkoI